ncbi:alpha/beta hydrolase [Streptomyces sp. NPDC058953]|uniref:alpha/beta hydrolase n=1 Tax=unclassified Streptomyces TaxID=2593676 RepID=UPI0036A96634
MTTHPSRRRRGVSVLLALSASAALASPAAVASAAPGSNGANGTTGSNAATAANTTTPQRVQRVQWGPCPRVDWPYPNPASECATIEVPADWSKPKGKKTGLFVARHKATDPSRRIGVLMSNPGGPGTPGADDAYAPDDPYQGYPPEVLARFDVVGFDPRGVARSRGVECDETPLAQAPARPGGAAAFERLRAANAKFTTDCLRKTGPLAAHMDAESTARDMDAIRAALGENRISFIGHSYGTLIGERYARLFPDRLRALALDSALDPAHEGAERYLTDGAVTLDNTLKRVSSWCATNAATCAVKNKKVTTVAEELFARADAGTLREPGPNGPTNKKITPDRLSDFLSQVLGGEPENVARELAALHSGKGEIHWIDGGAHETALRLVLCRDKDYRIKDYAEYEAIRARVAKAAPYVRYEAQSLHFVLACQGSPLPPKPNPAQSPGKLPPVLVVNATLDLATPLPGARKMAESFPRAELRIVDMVGHWLYTTGLPGDPKGAMDKYLLNPRS